MNDDAIKKEAKDIMDNFMNAMQDIDVEEDFVLDRKQCFREEGEGNEIDDSFRQKFLANAPKIRGDAILTRKGEWAE